MLSLVGLLLGELSLVVLSLVGLLLGELSLVGLLPSVLLPSVPLPSLPSLVEVSAEGLALSVAVGRA